MVISDLVALFILHNMSMIDVDQSFMKIASCDNNIIVINC